MEVRRAIEISHKVGQVIASHRSISTESVDLSHFTVNNSVDDIKIGPLYTDYFSIIRLNELIRLTGIHID